MLLVHFPTALLPMEFVLNVIYFLTDDKSFASAAVYSVLGGVTFGWAAIIFGTLDLIKIEPDRERVQREALLHGLINGAVILIYTVLAWAAWKQYPLNEKPTILALSGRFILVTTLLAGNFIGGNLVIKQKVGIE
jgi:uncharacterized membrane protein